MSSFDVLFSKEKKIALIETSFQKGFVFGTVISKSHDMRRLLKGASTLDQDSLSWLPTLPSEAGLHNGNSSLFSKASYMKKARLPTWEYSQEYVLCSEGNLKGRILGMFGAMGTSMEASKNSISPKVTALKRAKSVYCKTAFFFFLRLTSSNCSCFSCDHYWTGTLPREHPQRRRWGPCYPLQHVLTNRMSFNAGLVREL